MLSNPPTAASSSALIRFLSSFRALSSIVAVKSGYAAFNASIVVIASFGSIFFSSFLGLFSGCLPFCKPPGVAAGLFNNILGTVLKFPMSIGTELTMILPAFSMTVWASSNISSSQKPFSTASSPVHHVSSDIKPDISSAVFPVFTE